MGRTQIEIDELLKPLVQALESGRSLRLLARPGGVLLDRAEGAVAAPVPWDEATHQKALAALVGGPRALPGGVTAAAVGELLVLRAPANPLRRLDELAREGWLSSLAARTLSAAVGLGRNVLLLGPWMLAQELGAALCAEGQRPAVTGDATVPVPPTWCRVDSAATALLVGADRLGAWSLAPGELVELMARASGVVGFIDARRLDRGLIRFEAAVQSAQAAGPTPLHVLAALDLVVVLSPYGGPHVSEIAEISLVGEGYRPRLVFASGLPPSPHALVPLAAPSFVAELDQAGQGVLADELRNIAPPRPPVIEPTPAPAPPLARPVREAASRSVAATHDVVEPSVEGLGAVGAPPPGWELDQLPEESLADEGASQSADDAAMAAAYGLAPPPRPPGVGGESGANFEDALRRAKEREAEAREGAEE